MDDTERFVRDQNVRRFADQLMGEQAPERRAALRRLLIEEEDRFGLFSERLDRARRLITEAKTRIATLERVCAANDNAKDAERQEDLLANCRATLEIFTLYAQRLGSMTDEASP